MEEPDFRFQEETHQQLRSEDQDQEYKMSCKDFRMNNEVVPFRNNLVYREFKGEYMQIDQSSFIQRGEPKIRIIAMLADCQCDPMRGDLTSMSIVYL
jgi:hypothetical protein